MKKKPALKGILSADSLKKALERQRLFGGKIGTNLVALGLLNEEQMSDFFRFFPAITGTVEETQLETTFQPGNGKTTIAEAIGRSLTDSVLIPYSVIAGGQVIVVYDDVNHHQVPERNDSDIHDHHRVRVRRPVIFTGRELPLESLDMRFNSFSKYYEAPLHMKANNGIFIPDDFGRQMVN